MHVRKVHVCHPLISPPHPPPPLYARPGFLFCRGLSASGHESPKKSAKCFPGPGTPESLEKVYLFETFSRLSRLFRDFSRISGSPREGPEIEKFKFLLLRDWKFGAKLKISSEPPTKHLFMWGIRKLRDWTCQARLKISSELTFFKSLGI